MSKFKDSAVPKEIIDYLRDQNRPFSANDIFSNLPMDCSKAAKTKALELLVSEEKIKEKTYGKQKVYFVNQNIFDSKNDDLQSMDAQINELSNILNTLQRKTKSLEVVLADLNKCLPTEMAKTELKAVKSELSVLGHKLKNLESKSGHFDPNEKKTLFEKKEKNEKVYKRRKRLANNVIDAILEGYPKSKKQLLEELGVETDDDKICNVEFVKMIV